jgi:dephospho-CoA kinase
MNTSNDLPELIGLSGSGSAGQDTLAEYLVENFGFTQASTSDMVRAAAMERYGDIERETLQKVGPELRAESGAGALVLRALSAPRPTVITGIRTLGEAKELIKAGGVLIFIDADPKLRYERMIKRARDGEVKKSFDEFMAVTKKELYAGPSDADYNLRDISKMAASVIDNSGTKEEFIRTSLELLTQQQTNPS